MKKSAILLILLTLLFTGNVSAQEDFNFSRAYSDYIFNLSLYNKAFENYQLARANYLASETLTSKQKAYDTTLTMLETRDETVATHLTALRMKIRELGSLTDHEKEVNYTKIDPEVSWFGQHKDNLKSAGTLEDLVEDSEEARDKYRETEVTMYQALGAVQIGKVVSLRLEIEKIIEEIEEKLTEIRINEDKDTSKIERWILETETRLIRSKEKEIEAKGIHNGLKAGKKSNGQIFNNAQIKIEEANQFLREANGFLKEIIKEIKTQDS